MLCQLESDLQKPEIDDLAGELILLNFHGSYQLLVLQALLQVFLKENLNGISDKVQRVIQIKSIYFDFRK